MLMRAHKKPNPMLHLDEGFVRCPDCKGWGWNFIGERGAAQEPCNRCNTTGEVPK